jgi:hypothetical protein
MDIAAAPLPAPFERRGGAVPPVELVPNEILARIARACHVADVEANAADKRSKKRALTLCAALNATCTLWRDAVAPLLFRVR